MTRLARAPSPAFGSAIAFSLQSSHVERSRRSRGGIQHRADPRSACADFLDGFRKMEALLSMLDLHGGKGSPDRLPHGNSAHISAIDPRPVGQHGLRCSTKVVSTCGAGLQPTARRKPNQKDTGEPLRPRHRHAPAKPGEGLSQPALPQTMKADLAQSQPAQSVVIHSARQGLGSCRINSGETLPSTEESTKDDGASTRRIGTASPPPYFVNDQENADCRRDSILRMAA